MIGIRRVEEEEEEEEEDDDDDRGSVNRKSWCSASCRGRCSGPCRGGAAADLALARDRVLAVARARSGRRRHPRVGVASGADGCVRVRGRGPVHAESSWRAS
jgi:hypothetical protein